MTTKEQLHRLIDDLSDGEADMALRTLGEQHEDPLLRAIANAPEDDEPLTSADEAAIAEGQADIAAGRTVSLEDIEGQYGYR
jgi:predicted transcriptional regulator